MMLAAAALALSLAQPYPPYPPPPPYAPPPPPPGWRPPAPPPVEPRGVLGLVLMPLGTSTLSAGYYNGYYGPYQTYSNAQAAVAIEVRGQRGGSRLRINGEFSQHDRIFDVSLKYNFLDRTVVQPFLTLGLGLANLGPETAWRGTFVTSAGIDFFLTRDFFISAEAKWRAFSDVSPYDPHGVYGPGVSMWTALLGAGIYF